MGNEAQTPPHFLREWRKHRDMTQDKLAELVGIERSAISKIERGENPLMQDRLGAFAKALGIQVRQLFELPPKIDNVVPFNAQILVEGETNPGAISEGGETRTESEKEPLDVEGPVIGAVQAGAWTEAYQYPKEEWEWMAVPRDDRFPGIPQYLWKNVGRSMDRVCQDGGYWAGVLYDDLGQSPAYGQYVIVERERDGLVEATAKIFKMGPDGQPWLYPDSHDPSFKPIPLSVDNETEKIRVVARIVRPIGPRL